MWEVAFGVVLTAAIGGLLVPLVKGHIDQRREQFKLAGELLETLATSLWTYWKLALRIAYYGKKGPDFSEAYAAALEAWDSDKAWDNGAQIQIQISRSKRACLPEDTHEDLDRTQRTVVEELDTQVEDLRQMADKTAWDKYYEFLYRPRRDEIQGLLFLLTEHLALAQRAWLIRRWRKFRNKTPARIGLASNPNGDGPTPTE